MKVKKKVKVIGIVIIVIAIIFIIFRLNRVFASTDSSGMLYNTFQESSKEQQLSEKTSRIRKMLNVCEIIAMIIGASSIFILMPKNIAKKKKMQKRLKELNCEKINEESESDKELEEIKKEKEVLGAERLVVEKNIKKIKAYIVLDILFGIITFFIALVLYTIPRFAVSAKPIIYLYPETEQVVTVSLGYPEKLTCSYPKYDSYWEVLAKPNGDLVDLKTNKNLYALYWEGKNTNKFEITEGFCVKGEDTANFLEEKLIILGLSEREAEEFIVYWLPRLEKNKYNLIRFETIEEINENMPLTINPEPDTLIRVLMEFKASDKYVSLPEQELVTPERVGFVAVEWGGTEIE